MHGDDLCSGESKTKCHWWLGGCGLCSGESKTKCHWWLGGCGPCLVESLMKDLRGWVGEVVCVQLSH